MRERRERDRQRQTDRERETETEKDRERQRQRDRDKERQREQQSNTKWEKAIGQTTYLILQRYRFPEGDGLAGLFASNSSNSSHRHQSDYCDTFKGYPVCFSATHVLLSP